VPKYFNEINKENDQHIDHLKRSSVFSSYLNTSEFETGVIWFKDVVRTSFIFEGSTKSVFGNIEVKWTTVVSSNKLKKLNSYVIFFIIVFFPFNIFLIINYLKFKEISLSFKIMFFT
jgi:hypothetical protein